MVDRLGVNFDPKMLLSTVEMRRTTSGYGTNDIIFGQGDIARAAFFIQSGLVKIATASIEGKEAVVALLGTGDLCGERCLGVEALRVSTATAISDCIIVRIDKAALVRLVRDEPEFAEWLIVYLLERKNRVESDLADQILNTSEMRLARLLLLLAGRDKDGKLRQAVPMISQEIMGEMIGTTRARVNFFMNKFRNLGLIDYDNGVLQVHDSLTRYLKSRQATMSVLTPREGARTGP